MSHILIVGCGVVGAAIAYELSLAGLQVTVIDRQLPAQAATGAALGVLMGVISHKIKGNAWQMRSTSIQCYETLIPELEALTKRRIPFNRQGILMLCFQEEDLAGWEKLAAVRSAQGWQLEIWNAAQLQSRCPHLSREQIRAAIYSPQDRQVEPSPLTLALVEAAQQNGVQFHFGVTVTGYVATSDQQIYLQIEATSAVENAKLNAIQNIDWLVIAAGLGSTQLQSLQQSTDSADSTKIVISSPTLHQTQPTPVVEIKPVLGQAIHLQVNQPLGNPDFQPVITGNDVHIVPCVGGQQITDYWVGATVEFPTNGQVRADATQLEAVRQQAIAFCPALADAKIIRTWSGLRPRPEGHPAPVIGNLHGFSNILLATGHYRNGVLLAPATAQKIREVITRGEG